MAPVIDIRLFLDVAVLRDAFYCARPRNRALRVPLTDETTIPSALFSDSIRAMSDFTTDGSIAFLIDGKPQCRIVNVVANTERNIDIHPLPKTLDYQPRDRATYIKLDLHLSRLWVSYQHSGSLATHRDEYCVSSGEFVEQANVSCVASHLFEGRFLATCRLSRNILTIEVTDLSEPGDVSLAVWRATFAVSDPLLGQRSTLPGLGVFTIRNGFLITNRDDRCRFWDLKSDSVDCKVPLSVPGRMRANPLCVTSRGMLYARMTGHLEVFNRETESFMAADIAVTTQQQGISWEGAKPHFFGESLFVVSSSGAIVELVEALPLSSWKAWPSGKEVEQRLPVRLPGPPLSREADLSGPRPSPSGRTSCIAF